MNHPTRILLTAALGLIMSVTAQAAAASKTTPRPPDYTITMIPLLPGDIGLEALAMNNEGDAVGYAYNTPANFGTPTHAFFYHNGKVINLAPFLPSSLNSSANGINDFGEIIGFYSGGSFIYQNGHVQLFPNTSTDITSFYAINDLGQIIGRTQIDTLTGNQSYTTSATEVLRQPNGAIVTIPPFKGVVLQLTAINNVGQILASYDGYDSDNVPIRGSLLLQAGRRNPVDLGMGADGLNDWGQVVGAQDYGPATGQEVPALYSGGKVTDLGALAGFDGYTVATHINDFGVIVGVSFTIGTATTQPTSVTTVYANGTWYDLNKVSGFGSEFLFFSVGINNAGVIVAVGGNQSVLSYILTPAKATGSAPLK